MKKNSFNLVILLIIAISFSSCSTEENVYTIKKRIKNTSNQSLELLLIGYSNDTIVNQILLPQSSTPEFSYTSNINDIMGWGDVASKLNVRFLNNNTGYECNVENTGNMCFTTKGSPFDSRNPQDYILDDNIYTYEITQEDYENAHVLP